MARRSPPPWSVEEKENLAVGTAGQSIRRLLSFETKSKLAEIFYLIACLFIERNALFHRLRPSVPKMISDSAPKYEDDDPEESEKRDGSRYLRNFGITTPYNRRSKSKHHDNENFKKRIHDTAGDFRPESKPTKQTMACSTLDLDQTSTSGLP